MYGLSGLSEDAQIADGCSSPPAICRLASADGRRRVYCIHMPSAAWTSRRQTVIILHLPPVAWPSRRQMAITTCIRRPVSALRRQIILAKLNQRELKGHAHGRATTKVGD
jgi:hypothetical protein